MFGVAPSDKNAACRLPLQNKTSLLPCAGHEIAKTPKRCEKVAVFTAFIIFEDADTAIAWTVKGLSA